MLPQFFGQTRAKAWPLALIVIITAFSLDPRTLGATNFGKPAVMDPWETYAALPEPPSKKQPKKEVVDPHGILGPLPVRNFQPVHLLFFEFTPERAYALPQGRLKVRLDISESNTLLDDTDKEPLFKANTEMTRFTGRVKYGLTNKFTLGLNIPVVYIHGPFLDAFIYDVEDAVDRLRKERRLETRDQVDIRLTVGGTEEFNVQQSNFGVSDVSVEGMYQILQETSWIPAMSIRAAVKFPTGKLEDLHGSGKFDGAFGVAIQKIWGRWSAATGGGVTIPSNPFKTSGLKPDPIGYGHLTVDMLLSSQWALGIQMKLVGGLMKSNTQPKVRPLTNRSMEVNLGAKWAFARNWLAQFGIVQDIEDSSAVDADITFYLAIGSQVDLR